MKKIFRPFYRGHTSSDGAEKKYSISQEVFIPSKTSQNGVLHTKEEKALREFKAKVADLIKPEHDDHYLSKWLKARNYDVNKAEEMFKASMAYREKMKVDSLLKEYTLPEVLQKYLAGGFCGYDKEGSPVLLELYGHLDMKGILYSAKKSDIERSKLLMGEQVMSMLEEQSKKLGRPVEGMTVIIDMENCGTWMLWGPGIQMYAHMGRILQDNYPEIVKRTFIVNAPGIFPLLWKMFRPLVTESMKKKVCILGADYKQELLRHIEATQLPAFLGGELKDPDGNPRCPSKICQGGKVPEEYYLRDLSNTESFKTATVAHGDKLETRIPVTQEGSVLRWEFKTDGYDLGFGVFYEGPSGREAVHPVERVNSHMVPEDGTHICQKTGDYIIVFDNSYSWTRAKTVYYNTDAVPPDDLNTAKDLDEVTKGGSWSKVSDETCMTKL